MDTELCVFLRPLRVIAQSSWPQRWLFQPSTRNKMTANLIHSPLHTRMEALSSLIQTHTESKCDNSCCHFMSLRISLCFTVDMSCSTLTLCGYSHVHTNGNQFSPLSLYPLSVFCPQKKKNLFNNTYSIQEPKVHLVHSCLCFHCIWGTLKIQLKKVKNKQLCLRSNFWDNNPLFFVIYCCDTVIF